MKENKPRANLNIKKKENKPLEVLAVAGGVGAAHLVLLRVGSQVVGGVAGGWNFGGGYLDGSGNWALNSDANVKAVEYIKQLIDSGYCNSAPPWYGRPDPSRSRS